MKDMNQWWIVIWFTVSVMFFVLATIAAVNNDNDRSLALLGCCLGCHARAEVKILQRDIDHSKGERT